jgi:hypothetical protein
MKAQPAYQFIFPQWSSRWGSLHSRVNFRWQSTSVPIGEVIRVFKSVGENYPNFYRSSFNEAKRDYDVVIKTEKRGEISIRG